MDGPNLERTYGEDLARSSSQRSKKTEVLRCRDGEEGGINTCDGAWIFYPQ